MVNIQEVKTAIGDEAFSTLVELFAGQNIYIPKNFNEKYPDKKIRDAYIRSDYHYGMNVDDLAAKYYLSKATIYKIIEMK